MTNLRIEFKGSKAPFDRLLALGCEEIVSLREVLDLSETLAGKRARMHVLQH